MSKIASLAAAAALSVSLTSVAHAELVTNGGFSTAGFAGWTVTTAGSGSAISQSSNPIYLPVNGTLAVFSADGSGDDTLSQTLATEVDHIYQVSFSLKNITDFAAGNRFGFAWGGASLLDRLNAPNDSGWLQFQYTVSATSASTTIAFAGRNASTGFVLDNVSVIDVTPAPPPSSGVPEPASLALAALGLLGTAAASVRKRG